MSWVGLKRLSIPTSRISRVQVRSIYTRQIEKKLRKDATPIPNTVGVYNYMRKEDVTSLSLMAHIEKYNYKTNEDKLTRPTSDQDAIEILHDVNRRIAPSRSFQHYRNTLKSDLMYMTYWHKDHITKRLPGASRRRVWDMTNPYHAHRSMLPPGIGGRGVVPNPSYKNVKTIPSLESITLSFVPVPSVALNAENIAFLYMLLGSLTGEPIQSKHPVPYGAGTNRGMVPVRVTRRAARYKIRPGSPISAKVTLTGHAMYNFLEMLITFVYPRLRSDGVLQLPKLPTNSGHVANYMGSLSTVLPGSHLRYFPSIEYNSDRYPPLPNLLVSFKANSRGRGAPDQLMALLSGFGVPLVKRKRAKKTDRVGLWT